MQSRPPGTPTRKTSRHDSDRAPRVTHNAIPPLPSNQLNHPRVTLSGRVDSEKPGPSPSAGNSSPLPNPLRPAPAPNPPPPAAGSSAGERGSATNPAEPLERTEPGREKQAASALAASECSSFNISILARFQPRGGQRALPGAVELNERRRGGCACMLRRQGQPPDTA